ncbi:uncharacterized protein DNG_00297 [Cephalotrichum gorgonifer]|uniref:MGS207 protein n=1 Tax=Cephalotrichum gorgonifer TaxID=2041049 RepID=A0AAE8MNZ8_9PEZI|nr:uncharacterized protein DNG_00297 [Cephalotrichum gorgonifer]
MASFLSYVPVLNRFIAGSGSPEQVFDIPPPDVHDTETSPDRRARCLKHLLKANHATFAVIYHNLEFDNHNPHILSSAYLLGASEDQLRNIYEKEVEDLEPWAESPGEVGEDDWTEYLGDRRYQRAYVDYFEDQLVMRFSYDWKKLLEHYMFHDKHRLVYGLFGGLGHPLIHLGYAYEMNCKEIAIDALTMGAVQHNYLHKYLEYPKYTRPSPFTTHSISDLLGRLRGDKRFDGIFKRPGLKNFDELFEKHEDLLLEYWNAWEISDPVKQFEECQEVATSLLVATVPPGTHSYNFFFAHALTTTHALRVLLPLIPTKYQLTLVRGWLLYTLAIYISFLRPEIDPDYIDPSTLKGRHWSYVENAALTSTWATDAHYVKALRAIEVAARTWGDVHERYLAAAVRLADDFHGWTF